jgi:RNA polymerase sigma-70 factor (ECF subfamily)
LTADHRQAVEQLFRAHGRGVGNYVFARIGDLEQAEEITSRVFLKVADNIGRLRGELAPWLWAIVKNELARHFRDGRRFEPVSDALPSHEEAPDDQMARKQAREKLRAALAHLPEEQQQIVFLKFFENLGNQEIAKVTGLTPSNVGVTVHRTLKQLRALLGGCPDALRSEEIPW